MASSLARGPLLQKVILAGAFLCFICQQSCSRPTEFPVRDAVLSEGEVIQATNKNGTVRVSYVSTTKRKYEWDGRSRVIKMIPRQERFGGKLGLYEPADSWGLNPFEIRLVVEEAVRSFDDEADLQAALGEGSSVMDWVYTNDGLVVGFGRIPSRKQIDIDIFQFLVRGKKPTSLQASRPEQISVRYSSK